MLRDHRGDMRWRATCGPADPPLQRRDAQQALVPEYDDGRVSVFDQSLCVWVKVRLPSGGGTDEPEIGAR